MANNTADNRGAMGKDPSLPKTSKRGNWKFNGQWVNPEGYKVDGYGKVIPGQNKPFVPANKNPFGAKQTAPTTPTGAPPPPTQEQVVDQGFRQGADAYSNIVGQFNEFDPATVQQQYQPAFTQEMDRARNAMMSQFDRRNQEQFAREQEMTRQQIVDRGLDPNSPAAQALVRDTNDRQDRARQEAMNAAEQQAYGVQQQAYGQATGLAMMPYEQFSAIQAPYAAGVSNQYSQQQLAQQFGYEKQLNEQRYRYQQKLQNSQRGGAGGGNPNAAAEAAFANSVISRYGPQGGQPNQTAGQSFATGVQQGGVLGTMRGS